MKLTLIVLLMAALTAAHAEDAEKTKPKNAHLFAAECSTIWPHMIQTFTETGFQPLFTDMDAGVATFKYPGVSIGDDAKRDVTTFTTREHRWHDYWRGFRIDATSVTLAADGTSCNVTIVMRFAASFGTNRNPPWFRYASSYALENGLLATIAAKWQER